LCVLERSFEEIMIEDVTADPLTRSMSPDFPDELKFKILRRNLDDVHLTLTRTSHLNINAPVYEELTIGTQQKLVRKHVAPISVSKHIIYCVCVQNNYCNISHSCSGLKSDRPTSVSVYFKNRPTLNNINSEKKCL